MHIRHELQLEMYLYTKMQMVTCDMWVNREGAGGGGALASLTQIVSWPFPKLYVQFY